VSALACANHAFAAISHDLPLRLGRTKEITAHPLLVKDGPVNWVFMEVHANALRAL
jgi:hypothetical protein